VGTAEHKHEHKHKNFKTLGSSAVYVVSGGWHKHNKQKHKHMQKQKTFSQSASTLCLCLPSNWMKKSRQFINSAAATNVDFFKRCMCCFSQESTGNRLQLTICPTLKVKNSLEIAS